MSGGEVAHRGRETSLEIDYTEARGRGRVMQQSSHKVEDYNFHKVWEEKSFRRGTEEETDRKTATAEMENSRQFEIRDEKTWASLSRGGEEMRYKEEDEWLALKTETKETREILEKKEKRCAKRDGVVVKKTEIKNCFRSETKKKNKRN